MPIDERYLHSDITNKILSCVHKVFHIMGSGFAERLYENALVLELRELGLHVEQQYPFKVYYKGALIGEYVADLLVENKVIVELKAVEALSSVHEAQHINYLKATGKRVGLVVNFL